MVLCSQESFVPNDFFISLTGTRQIIKGDHLAFGALILRSKYESGFRYGLAALSAIAALLLREGLGAAFGAHYPYHTVWLAIIFAAWYCGVWPSILAVAIDAIGIWYWFLPPYPSFAGKR
jgi:hypothetical protein